MFTVMELFSHPLFHNFQLVAGASGLYNVVSGTGIFDWESSADVDKTFAEGEFVVTTLSQAKDDVTYAENCLKMLIERGVCAIAIKTVYFKEISEELKAYSTLHNIPIFLFSDTYFDDIIFTIKNALFTSTLNSDNTEKIRILINQHLDSDLIVKMAKEINPFFFENILCCFASSYNNDINMEKYPVTLDSSNMVYSMIPYVDGIIIIYTAKNTSFDLQQSFLEFIQKLGIHNSTFMIGLSNAHLGLENMSIAMKECIYANASCVIDHEPSGLRNFDSIGLDRLLMPVHNDMWAKNYYEDFLDKVLTQDALHNSNLMDTLLEYVKCNGNIKLTAKMSFQHSNTIRYRLDKVKKILNIEESVDGYPQFYIFVRLFQIHKYLDKLR